jgi:hypothetical protein
MANTNKLLPSERHLVNLTTIINIGFFFICIIAIVISLINPSEHFESYVRFALLALVCLITIFINYSRYYLLAKILTVIAPFLCIFIFPIMTKAIHGGMFLWFPYGIIIVGSISFFIFSWENEKIIVHLLLIFFGLSVIFYDKFLGLFAPASLDLTFIYNDNYLYYNTSKVLLLIVFYSSVYQYKTVSFKRQKEIEYLSQQLKELNDNLEIKIKERTAKLDLQNKKIKELTYSNSHKVRAYVARIVGLIYLCDEAHSEEEKSFYYKNINTITYELDEETKKISETLAEEYI